jgi:hypothetical protein
MPICNLQELVIYLRKSKNCSVNVCQTYARLILFANVPCFFVIIRCIFECCIPFHHLANKFIGLYTALRTANKNQKKSYIKKESPCHTRLLTLLLAIHFLQSSIAWSNLDAFQKKNVFCFYSTLHV